jgi:hypothetical protein
MSPAMGLSAQQQAMVDVILRVFREAGFPPVVGMAAVANAYAESALNPNAVGDSGASIGLFQLHERGVGSGMSAEARRDPETNAEKMADWARRESRFMAVANNPASTLSDVTYAFCVYLERPANADAKGKERAGIAARMFPQATTVSTSRLRSWSAGPSPVVLALTGSAAALALVLLWVNKDTIRARIGG